MKMVSLVEINSSQLSSLAIVDGQLICCLDTSDFYRDIKNYRIKLSSDIIFVDSLPLAPLYNRIYFLTTDCVLYTYLNDDWVAINMNTYTLISELNKKVDKVSGKGLSTNDFTNELKTKLDGIATGANKYTLPTASSSTLGGVKTGSNITNSSGTISITKANIIAALGYTPPTQDTNTHYASKNVVGATNSTSNTTTALTNGNVYLNSVENNAVTSSHKISGSGATSVTTDASGNIIVSSTNTTYSTMKGATSSTNGSAGLVPAPASGKQASFLRGDGTWAIPVDTKVSQKIGTTNADRRVLLSWSANDTEESSYVVKSANFIANPVTGQFYAKGYKRNDITGVTLDIDTLTLSDGYPEIMRYIEKTNAGSNNITNIPVANQPFILDVELIRWATNTDYITKQTFTPILSSTLNDDEYVRFCNNGTWTAWKKRLFTDNNTTYSVATTSANGLMSSSDKTKLDGIAANANNYTLPAATSSTLGGVKIGSNITNSSGTISITKANVTAALGYTPPTQDTNTHYESKNIVGATNATSNTTTALTNGNVYLNSVENGAVTSSHKISGSGATSVTTDASGNIIISSTNTTYSTATTSTNGLMSSSDKSKLDGIATGANKTVVDSSLSSSSTNPVQNKVIYTALSGKLNTSLKGSNNGLAELDENGKVPSSQLPSYVDDVIDGYLNNGKFYSDSKYTTEITGETGKIYINLSNSKTYRWSGSAFAVISETIALGETSSTAYRGDRGKIAYSHSQLTSGNPHGVTKSDIGLSNVENKSSATIRGELTKDNVVAALGYTPPTQDTNTHYASKNVVGGNTATSNTTTALTNGNVYLNSVENNAVTSSHKISGSGATTVITDTSGNIIVKSTNTTYGVATTSANGLMSSSDKTKLDGIAANANNYSLPAATDSVLGGVKIGSNITNSSGTISISKDNVTSALGYTPPTQDTTYSNATTSTAGLMSSSDKSKLDGIATGANNYTLPTATSSVLGGVKIGSNITNSSGTISITKANVTAALGYTPPTQDTNTHYTSKNVVGGNTATSNTTTALTNGNVYLNSVENNAVTSSHKISGSGATSVTTDANGNIIISSNNTTYATMTGATSSTSGSGGLVPQPTSGKQASFLRGDGTWAIPVDTKVTQKNATADSAKRVILSANANDTEETNYVVKSVNFTANPTTGEFYAKGYKRNDITGSTLDINTLTLSSGHPEIMRYIEKTSDGAANITNTPVANQPFILDVELIRWESTSDYVTKQTFVPVYATDDEYVRYCGGGTWTAWKKRLFTDNNTTYSVATTSANGLMSSSDKSKLDGIAANANNYSLPAATSSALGGVKIGSNITNSSGTISITKANVTAALGYTPPTQDTNTHYASKNVVGTTNATSNTTSALTNGNVYLNSVENNAVTSSHKISGSGATSVTTDTSGNIVISSTNTTYSNATTSTAGLMSSSDKTKLDGIATGANKYILPTASSSTLGGVKTGSNITNSSGTISITKTNVCNALGYTPPEPDLATSNNNGLMSSDDKAKLDGIATGANKYVLPTASSTLGGVKTTSTVTEKTGYTATPIINGVPYYKGLDSLILLTDEDLNDYKTAIGQYYAGGTNTCTNVPDGVTAFNLSIYRSGAITYVQRLSANMYVSNKNREYIRIYYSETDSWSEWFEFYSSNNKQPDADPTQHILTSKDLNDVKDYGEYYAGGGNTCANKPDNVSCFYLKVGRGSDTNEYVVQELVQTNVTNPKKFIRLYKDNAWGEWDQYYTSKNKMTKSDIGLSNVENKSSATIRGELTKANVTAALGYTPPTQDTNTHYESKNVVGSNTATSNTTTALTNGNVYLNSVENNAVTSSHKISGSGATTVITDTSGNIIVKSTNTTYSTATTSANGLMSSSDKTKLDGIAANANNYTLPAATSSALGGVKIGSNITNSSGTISITKANVTAALGYTPPTTNTTYSVATTSANGLMSSSDKSKLDGIATGANKTVVDSTLSDTSTNPVQNKVINTALNSKSPKEGSTELVQLAANVIIGNGEGVASILHDQGEVCEKIEIIDNNTSGNAVFKFSQSTNSGESFDRLMQINDDGNIIANKFNGYTIASNVPANAKFTDTTYSVATTSANGLMSSSDKTKLDGIATGANKYTLPTASSSTLGGVKTGSNITNSSGTISITKANVVAALGYTPPTTDTNTHYVSKNVVGSNTATSNTTTALTNGNVYLNSVENGAVTSSHKISGNGATSVTTDANGNIVISSTNTTYSTATTSANGLMSSSDKSKLDGIATGANKTTVDSVLSDTSTNPVQNKVVYSALSGKSDTNHTHNYAGSSSVGGSADSAVKLQTARTINGVSFNGTANITITANPTQNQLTNQDLNSVQTYGEYYAGGSNTCTNKPSGVDPFNLKVVRSATGYIIQELTQASSGTYKKYTRQYNNSSWSEWKYYIDSTNISDTAFINFIGSDVGKTYSDGTTHTAQEMMLGTDYNDIIESGTYVIRGNSSYPTSNAPDGNNTSNVFYVIVIKYNSSYIKQIAFSARTFDTIYQRNMSGGKWTAWGKFSDDSKLVPYVGYSDDDILGLEVDYENNTYTRLAGAVGLSAGTDFDNFNMYGGRRRCIIHASGILGYYGDESYSNLIGSVQSSGYNIMVYQPRFYYRVVPLKLERNTDGIGYYMKKGRYYISDNPKPGFKLHPAFYDEDGNELEGIYYSAYENSIRQVSNDGDTITYTSYLNNEITSYDRKCELESIPGAIPCHGISITNLEKFATPVNNYAGISSCHLETIKTLSANQLLMMIEYGSLNLQNTLNKGISTLTSATSPIITGGTESLGNASGMASGTEGEVSFSYRGMENIYGNIFKSVQGILLFGNGNKKGGQPYIAKGFNYDYSTDPLINYDAVNFYIPSSGGYIKYFGYDENFDWLFLPVNVSGSSTAPVGDYMFDKEINDTFPYKISYGGRYKIKTQVGPFTYSANIAYNSVNASSETGGRVVYYPKYEGSTFA